MADPVHPLMRSLPGWDTAIDTLRSTYESLDDEARGRPRAFVGVYVGRRAAMVVDVVASRRRDYQTRVLKMVSSFETRAEDNTLATLARDGSGLTGLRNGEDGTMRDVAAGLHRFGQEHGYTDDDMTVSAWAAATDGLEVAHELDPYVGRARGIGPALFAYTRMRAGGNSIKADSRVRKALSTAGLGDSVPRSDTGLFILASAVATELGIGLLDLDQLLWHLAG